MSMRGDNAYGIFDSKASKEAIKADLPIIQRLTKTPGLELSLVDLKSPRDRSTVQGLLRQMGGIETFPIFPERFKHLMAGSKPKKAGNMDYMIEARSPTSGRAPEAVTTAVNQIYLNHGNNRPFNGVALSNISGRPTIYA